VFQEGLIQADEIPISMSTPTRGTVNPNSITINWTPITSAAQTGRDDIIYYHVMWEQTASSWVYLTNWPTTTTILDTFTHTLSSGIFSSGSTQNYKVCAENGVGLGACGTVAITADATPTAANAPVVDPNNISPTSIYLTWTEITSTYNGGDTVVYYRLEWEQTTNNWVELTTYTVGGPIQTSYTHTPGYIFTSGATINYRISAMNGVGYGVYSSTTPVLCDAVPPTMNVPVIATSDITYNSIKITWSVLTDFN
jgi:hypothetical protein